MCLQLKVAEQGFNSSLPDLPVACNVNASDEKFCNTALHWALMPNMLKAVDALDTKPYAELVKELIDGGADPCLENGACKTNTRIFRS